MQNQKIPRGGGDQHFWTVWCQSHPHEKTGVKKLLVRTSFFSTPRQWNVRDMIRANIGKIRSLKSDSKIHSSINQHMSWFSKSAEHSTCPIDSFTICTVSCGSHLNRTLNEGWESPTCMLVLPEWFNTFSVLKNYFLAFQSHLLLVVRSSSQ